MSDRRPAPDEFFTGLPEDLDSAACAIVRDLRGLLARVNAPNAQPRHTTVIAPNQGVHGYLELRMAHPRGDPHMTVSYREDDVYVFWTGGHLRETAWRPDHLTIVECLLTGRNTIEVTRRRRRIVSTDAEFWPPSGRRIGPLHSETPRPRLRRRLWLAVTGWRRGSSTTTYHQVSYQRTDPLLTQLEPFRAPADEGGLPAAPQAQA